MPSYLKEDNLKKITTDLVASAEKKVADEAKALGKGKNVKTAQGTSVNVDVIKGLINIKHADGSEEVIEIPVKEQIVTEALANIGYTAQITKNLGGYESAKLSVSLHLPTTVPDLEKNYTFVTEWVDGKMNGLLAMLAEVK